MIKKITIEDSKYPQLLKKIKDPPQQLYYEGNIDLLKENIIAIIGSRKATQKGKELAEKFAYELSKQGIVIASGMAKRN